MEKIKVVQQVKYDLEWYGGCEIDKLIEDLNKLKDLGATHLSIEHGVSYDCSYLDLSPYFERLETGEELAKRLDKEAKKKAEREAYELRILTELKAKYENK